LDGANNYNKKMKNKQNNQIKGHQEDKISFD